jgi:hypothetical protein
MARVKRRVSPVVPAKLFRRLVTPYRCMIREELPPERIQGIRKG